MTYEQLLTSIYTTNRRSNDWCTTDLDNLNALYISSEIKDGIIEIPCIQLNRTLNLLEKYKKDLSNFDTVLIPIHFHEGHCFMTYKSVNPILTYFFDRYSEYNQMNLCNLQLSDNSQKPYYGGKGLILDRYKTPLCLYTVSFKIDYADKKLSYYKKTLYINKKVFKEDDAICKYIKGKMLTTSTTARFVVDLTKPIIKTPSIITKDDIDIHIVDDMPFIKTTTPPNVTDTDSKINEFLTQNISGVTLQS